MTSEDKQKKSQLIAVLREGVAVVQMIFFKELKAQLETNHPDKEPSTHSMIAAAVTNELFGTPNPESGFVQFRQQHKAIIEQEMLGLAVNLPDLRRYITDALRVQTLCDNQEGLGNNNSLAVADKLGILLADRDMPLPSTFMTLVRDFGEQHQLIIPPAHIPPESDQSLVH